MKQPDFTQRVALHNAQAELEALRAEGRAMVWENEAAAMTKEPPPHVFGFTELAAKIRATKVQITGLIVEALQP